MSNNVESKKEEIWRLLTNMIPKDLPPFLDEVFKNGELLLDEFPSAETEEIFDFDDKKNYIKSLKKNVIASPVYIHGGSLGSESLKYFTFKKDKTWRPMAIPNLFLGIMFAHNSIIAYTEWMQDFYSPSNRKNGVISHSHSPIIGRDGSFWFDLYDEPTEYDKAVGFIGLRDRNGFFADSRRHAIFLEASLSFVLKIDFSNFYSNIYTHTFSNIESSKFVNNNKANKYIEWLDYFNMKVNDNHTKGIIQGPISSKISAEIFQWDLDYEIESIIASKELDIKFIRFVDDYSFFSREKSTLEKFKNELIIILRKKEMSINSQKLSIIETFDDNMILNNSFNITDLVHMVPFANLTVKHKIIEINDIVIFRDAISKLLSEQKYMLIKALLTILKNKFRRKEIRFKLDMDAIDFIQILFKTAYISPFVATHSMELVNEILVQSDENQKNECLSVIEEEFFEIDEKYQGTDFQIWYFYLIYQNISNSSDRCNFMNKILELPGFINRDSSPICLAALIKKNDKSNLNTILKEIIKQYKCDNNGNIKGIELSKWWLPITLARFNVDIVDIAMDETKKLFVTEKGKINWRSFGVIEFLARQRQN